MQVLDALRVEGTSHYEILCYGIYPRASLDQLHRSMQANASDLGALAYSLLSDDWPHGVLLLEAKVTTGTEVAGLVFRMLLRMFEVGSCSGALCMYDGAFSSCEDLFSTSLAGQTYAFCLEIDGPVLSLDSTVLSSDEWRSLIGRCRRRVRGE